MRHLLAAADQHGIFKTPQSSPNTWVLALTLPAEESTTSSGTMITHIAIAESVSGKPFSRYWLHGGHLFVDGKKMSKSKGNVYYPSDLTAKGFSGEQLRFFLIYGPYRKKLNFTFEKLSETSPKTRFTQKNDCRLAKIKVQPFRARGGRRLQKPSSPSLKAP